MNKKNIKIAVIGAGYWGKNLVRNFYELGVLSLVCDGDDEVLKKTKDLYPDVEVTKDSFKIFKNKSIDAVVVSLPAKMHYEYAKKALLSKKNVFVEKPLSLNHIEAEELIGIAGKNKKIIMVGHLLQYHPAFIKLKEIVSNGELGRLNYIYSNRLNLGKIRKEENILWSFAPHDISMILSLINEEPRSVFSKGGFYLNNNVADVTITSLDFPSGIKSHIFVSWLHPYKRQELVLVGEKKMAVFDDTKNWDEKLLIYPHELNWKDGLPVPNKKEAEKIFLEESEPLKNECRHFISCILNNTKPITDGEEGLKVIKVLEASQKSLDSEKIIYFNDIFNYKDKKDNYFVNESSYVDGSAEIGEGTKIWHFSHIMSGAKIGKNCSIGQNVVISSKAVVGDHVKIQNNVSVYDEVIIEDEVFCGPSCVFTNVINPRAFVSRKHEFKRTLVRRGATIGANATIICGNELGEYCFIGAGAVVTKDVKPHALIVGNPGKQVGWVCECGTKLESGDKENLECVCGKKYKLANDKLAKR